MTKEVMAAAKWLRDSDLPLMDRAVKAGKLAQWFAVGEVFELRERTRAVEAMRLSRQFEIRVVKTAAGRMRQEAHWIGFG